jgi:N-carbamoyl-L-amino-acid hydrolase
MNRRHFTRALGMAAAGAALPRGLLAADTLGARVPVVPAPPRVNGTRLNAHLTALSEFGRNPQGGVTRLAYTGPDLAAREYAKARMKEAGLVVRVDAVGNIYGTRAGKSATAKPIIFGSHVDSVPEGGNFDGPVGVFGAIEVAQTLKEQNVVTTHPLEVVVWQNEEGGTWGSHLITAEQVTPEELATVSRSGLSIADGIRALGADPANVSAARRARGSAHAYVELHIEQGGNLDRERLDIGVVEGIVGLRQWEVTIDGFANHAGTTPMDVRRDAMLSAARFIEAVNRIVRAEPGRQVGTVGRIQAFPGAPNVVPGRVICTLELRDLDDAKIARLYESVRAEATRIGAQNETTFAYAPLVTHESARCDERVRAMIGAAAKDQGLSTKSLPSGAGHDAQNLARICPMGMIFVPSIGGISHSPKEFSRAADITNGANVLLDVVLRLDAATLS